MSTTSNDYRAQARTGWILLAITCGLSLIPIFGFSAWLIAGPMLIAAFVLAIVVLSRGGTGHGILLLLFSGVIAPVFVFFAPFITTLLGLGGVAATTAAPANLKRFSTVAEAQQEVTTLREQLAKPEVRLYGVVFGVTVDTHSKLQGFHVSKVIEPEYGPSDAVGVEVPQAFINDARNKVEAKHYKPRLEHGKPAEFFTWFFYTPSHPATAISNFDQPLDKQP